MEVQTGSKGFFSSRSRREDTQRCPRARWWLHEAMQTGYEPVRQAVPLVTGGSVHVGLAAILKEIMINELRPSGALPRTNPGAVAIDCAVDLALADYDAKCQTRGFELAELENQSFVYQEQRALVEGLVRLGGMRVIPRLLETYEVLEVEKLDVVPIAGNGDWILTWRSIPDGLLRERKTGDLYLLSWKTVGEFTSKLDEQARVDMQGVSEIWSWVGNIAAHAQDGQVFKHSMVIRGVQMVYLVKGARRKSSEMLRGVVADAAGNPATEVYKTASPLIYGYTDGNGLTPKMAWSSEWHCNAPHGGMRPSKWYPGGNCPGNKNHRRGDDWVSFPVWAGPGVKGWMEMLADGSITPEAGDALEGQYAIPVPYYRTSENIRSWHRQTASAERKVVGSVRFLHDYEEASTDNPNDQDLRELYHARLDEEFPQNTQMCHNWFGRKCPAWEICHGPAHIVSDPVGSGLYQIKEQYQPVASEVEA